MQSLSRSKKGTLIRKKPLPRGSHSSFPPKSPHTPHLPAKPNLLWLHGLFNPGHFVQMKHCNRWPFVTGLLHSAWRLQGSSFIHLITCAFLFLSPNKTPLWFQAHIRIWPVRSPGAGPVGGSCLLAIMVKSAVINVCVRVSMWTVVFISLVYTPKRGRTEPYGNSI